MASPSSIVKSELSGSTDGLGVKVAATSSAGTTIHTASSGTGDNNYDELWIWAVNCDTSAIKLTIQYGGTTTVDHDIEVTIPPEDGLVPVIPGLIIQNSLVVKAYAGTANKIVLYGYSNEITA